jgi:outer membrane lipoprotein SlyB
VYWFLLCFLTGKLMEKFMMRSKYSLSARITMVISAFLAAAFFSQAAQAVCAECGTVTEVKTVKVEGEGSGVGAVAGGILGGVAGHQVGGGRGKDLATIGGAVGGAYVGHQVEKKVKASTKYHVLVKMEDGTAKTFVYSAKTSYKAGDRIKVIKGKLTRA